MSKMRFAGALVVVAAGLTAACGSAPDETTGASNEALLGPPVNVWCTLITGNDAAKLAETTLRVTATASYSNPYDPNDPNDPIVSFQNKISSTLGAPLPTTFYARDTDHNWFAIDLTHMTTAQQYSMDIIANMLPWSSTTPGDPFAMLKPGVFSCKFDIGDWDEYYDAHPVYVNGRPTIPKPPYTPSMILAYDPCTGTQHCYFDDPNGI